MTQSTRCQLATLRLLWDRDSQQSTALQRLCLDVRQQGSESAAGNCRGKRTHIHIDLTSYVLDRTSSPITRRKRVKLPVWVEYADNADVNIHAQNGDDSVTLAFDRESLERISAKIGRNPFWSAEPVAVDTTNTVTAPKPASVQNTPGGKPSATQIHPD